MNIVQTLGKAENIVLPRLTPEPYLRKMAKEEKKRKYGDQKNFVTKEKNNKGD